MLMITVKYVLLSLDHFEMDEAEVFADITLSTFNIAYVSPGLSVVHWQQVLLMGLVHKHPVGYRPIAFIILIISSCQLYSICASKSDIESSMSSTTQFPSFTCVKIIPPLTYKSRTS